MSSLTHEPIPSNLPFKCLDICEKNRLSGAVSVKCVSGYVAYSSCCCCGIGYLVNRSPPCLLQHKHTPAPVQVLLKSYIFFWNLWTNCQSIPFIKGWPTLYFCCWSFPHSKLIQLVCAWKLQWLSILQQSLQLESESGSVESVFINRRARRLATTATTWGDGWSSPTSFQSIGLENPKWFWRIKLSAQKDSIFKVWREIESIRVCTLQVQIRGSQREGRVQSLDLMSSQSANS